MTWTLEAVYDENWMEKYDYYGTPKNKEYKGDKYFLRHQDTHDGADVWWGHKIVTAEGRVLPKEEIPEDIIRQHGGASTWIFS